MKDENGEDITVIVPYYSVLLFTTTDIMIDSFHYETEIPIAVMRATINSDIYPNALLFSGTHNKSEIHRITGSFLTPSTGSCLLKLKKPTEIYCIKCNTVMLLTKYTCKQSCENGYYGGIHGCAQCHHKCQTCTTNYDQCGSCSDPSLSGPNCIKVNPSCSVGHLATFNGVCVRSCPDKTIMTFITTNVNEDFVPFNPYFLKFINPHRGLELPAPIYFPADNFPDEWTITM